MLEIIKTATVYVFKPEFLGALRSELNTKEEQIYNNLLLSEHCNPNACFALDIWFEAQLIHFDSISEAASCLRKVGKYWYLHPGSHVRRSRLIEHQLKACPSLNRNFPIIDPLPPVGCFTLLDKNTLLMSTKRLKKWPMGYSFFEEDKVNPPNRAYLKLWEALSVLQEYPKAGEQVLDLGASPGGWTWVMHSLDTQVTAVDKATLDPSITKLPHVRYVQQSAFSLDPYQSDITYDWVLSDIACYPQRALELIKKWIASAKTNNLIVTIKLQGTLDINLFKQFQTIPNSYVTQLFYNKHEITFFYPHPYA